MERLATISEKIEIAFMIAVIVITLIAIARTFIRKKRGESIKITPVGVMNNLPESVTGFRKNDDMKERASERGDKRTE